MNRKWLYGNKKRGYSLTKLNRKSEPWKSQIWFEGRICRTDRHETKNDALEYIKGRRSRYGGARVYPKKKK